MKNPEKAEEHFRIALHGLPDNPRVKERYLQFLGDPLRYSYATFCMQFQLHCQNKKDIRNIEKLYREALGLIALRMSCILYASHSLGENKAEFDELVIKANFASFLLSSAKEAGVQSQAKTRLKKQVSFRCSKYVSSESESDCSDSTGVGLFPVGCCSQA